MRKGAAFGRRLGEWRVRFEPESATLECVHARSGARVKGVLSFQAIAKDVTQAWSIALAADAVPQRLALLDAKGEAQGYLTFGGAGGVLQVHCVHRTAQNYSGLLAFAGEARLGRDAFACRTEPPARTRVIQMASGPADSALNDSLFDAASDTVLRFKAGTVAVRSTKAAFALRMTARPESAGRSALVFAVEKDFYRIRYVPHYRPINKKRCPSPPTGWMSWNVYFDQAGEKENLDEARVGAKYLKPFGLEFWSIESWQENSDKLPVRDFYNLNLKPHPGQFPHGMKWLADEIRKLGFRPGIWTVPFGTGEEKFYQEHKVWFLHDAEGKPLSNWSGRYLLDPSQPAVRRHMMMMHKVMSRQWGYEFFKMDGMSGRSSGYSAHFYERADVRKAFKHPCRNPFELCVEACRKGMGKDAVFLACQGHYTGAEVAHADAARIGGDIVSPNQPSKWHNLISAATATLNQLFVHNIVWYADPDTLLVGDYHADESARIAAAIVALPGQMMFAGDKLAELRTERMRLLQQSLPVCDVRPLDLFPVFELLPVWDLKISRSFAEWDVVALFNWSDQEKQSGFTFEEIGLSAADVFLVYDFWDGTFLGPKRDGYACVLPPRSSRLLAVHRDLGRPQFLSTDRHITQGGTCLKDMKWDEEKGILSGTVAVVGGFPSTLFFYVPEGFGYASAKADADCEAAMGEDRVVRLSLASAATRAVRWQIVAPRAS